MISVYKLNYNPWGRRGRDRMVVGETTTNANQCLSPVKVWLRLMASRTRYNYVIKFVIDFR
jgi:hypothetical protein